MWLAVDEHVHVPEPSPFSARPAAVAAAGVSLHYGMQTPPLETTFSLHLLSEPFRPSLGVVGESCHGRRRLWGRLVEQLSRQQRAVQGMRMGIGVWGRDPWVAEGHSL